jgi:hypothetical protein
MALVDGLQDDERALLLKSAAGLGLERQAAGAILNDVAAGGSVNVKPPSDPGARREIFDDLVRLVLADGEVSPRERSVLGRFAKAYGVTSTKLEELLGGGAAAAPTKPAGIRLEAPNKPKKQQSTGSADCPSCGAAVEFRNTRSVAVVCEYCDTTVTRSDAGGVLEDLGKVSHLVADASPIQLGSTGTCFGVDFEVIGRLQIEHATGLWNEWYVEWADRRTGWLSEGLGQYFVTFPADGDDGKGHDVPPFADLEVGRTLRVAGKRYVISEARVARATGTEGETPFAIGEGYQLPYADLRRPDAGFGTIDYSEDPPLVFTGRSVSWRDLNMRNFRSFDGWRS